MSNLITKRCKPCEGSSPPLTAEETAKLSQQISAEWKVSDDQKMLTKSYKFRNYYHTAAFINAVIWVAHQEDHHPDIQFGYNTCTIDYTTHAISGLSENDFICAAKIDALQINED